MTAELLDDPLLSSVPVHEGYKILGGVVLYRKLGQGGMGAVYKGRHLRLDIDVALKVTALPAGTAPEHAAGFLKRFIREARTAAAVRHPNLIRVYDVNAEAGVHYLIMDYVDGESAGDRLERRGRLSEQEAVEIALGAAEGLAAAHSQGIVHRDVKPDNILIDKKGNVVVADLGLAKAYVAEDEGRRPSTVTQTGVALGTPHYMSPEQFTPDRGVGPASDVWSLGVTLYQLLTARLPWTGANVFVIADNVRKRKLPDPKEFRGSLSDGVCRIMRKAAQKKASQRYADCGEVAEALRKHLDSIRTSQENVLADAEAGASKMALAAVSPPDPETMTFVEEAELAEDRIVDAESVEDEIEELESRTWDEIVEKRMELEGQFKSLCATKRLVADLWHVYPFRRLLAFFFEGLAPVAGPKLASATAEALGHIGHDLHIAERAEERREIVTAVGRLKSAEKKLERLKKAIARAQDAAALCVSRREFEKAIHLGIRSDIAYLRRGLSLLEEGNMDGAIQDFDVGVELRPHSPVLHYNRGRAKAAKGDLDGAIRDYDRAIELNPEAPKYYQIRAEARTDKGDVEGANRDFETARRLGYSGDE